MAYQTDNLKTLIIERFGTQQAFAEALEIDKSTLSKYLSKGHGMKGATLVKAVRLLNIPDDKIDYYFFEPKVAKSQPRKKAKP